MKNSYSHLSTTQKEINELAAEAAGATGLEVAPLSSLLWSQRRLAPGEFKMPSLSDFVKSVEALKTGPGLDGFLALRGNGELRRMPHQHSRLVSVGTFEQPASLLREAALLGENARDFVPRLSSGDPAGREKAARNKAQEQQFQESDMAKRDRVGIHLDVTAKERAQLEAHSLKDLLPATLKSPGMDV